MAFRKSDSVKFGDLGDLISDRLGLQQYCTKPVAAVRVAPVSVKVTTNTSTGTVTESLFHTPKVIWLSEPDMAKHEALVALCREFLSDPKLSNRDPAGYQIETIRLDPQATVTIGAVASQNVAESLEVKIAKAILSIPAEERDEKLNLLATTTDQGTMARVRMAINAIALGIPLTI